MIPFTSPDSITNWAVHTLAITRRDGFCLPSHHPITTITTFKPFFIKVSFPASIVEREQTEVQVTAFNYQPTGTKLIITFERVKGLCSDWLHAPRATRVLPINGHSFAQTAFSLLPISSGHFVITIKAQAAKRGSDGSFVDTVHRNLTVLARGVQREHQLTFDLDPTNRAKRAARIDTGLYVDETTGNQQRTRVNLRSLGESKSGFGLEDKISASSANIVPQSVRYVVTAFGERYRPQLRSIEELSNLIQKPKGGGGGEENMFYAAFNLHAMQYLEQVDRLDPKTKARGVSYLKRALVQQLEFRKEDGSFAAFRRRNASIWLTAFVARTFCQAGSYLSVEQLDERIVQSALDWLQGKQLRGNRSNPLEYGSFQEETSVVHEKAMGGNSRKGSISLTAYILLVLRQCRPYLRKHFASNTKLDPLDRTVNLTENFVLANYQKEKEDDRSRAFCQALVAYALSFSSSPKAAKLKAELIAKLSSSSKVFPQLNQQYWPKVAWPVETAAYALLALITPNKGGDSYQKDPLQYMSIANWLNAQQMKGTFESTQDTVVALEALSKFYALYQKEEIAGQNSKSKQDSPTLQTDILFNKRLRRSLRFNVSNADLLQTVPVDRQTQEIDFETTGNGLRV